jgi:sugar transferase (PEP-CTERM system associated)
MGTRALFSDILTTRIFRHYVPTPLLVLALAEALIFFGSMYLAAIVRFGEIDFSLVDTAGKDVSLFPRAFLYALIMMSTFTAFGLYREDIRKDDKTYQTLYLSGFGIGGLTMAVLFYVVPQTLIGRGIMALAFLFSVVGSGVLRYAFFHALGAEAFKRRILVLGIGSRAAEVATLREKLGKHARFIVAGFVPFKHEQPSASKLTLIQEDCSLLALVHRLGISEIVVGVRDRRGGHLSMPELLECKLEGVSVIDLSSFFEREKGYVQLDSLNASWMVYSEGFRRNALRDLVKRAFDVSISLLVLVLMLPVMILTALAIWLEDGSPVLYRQERIGECGHPFKILKFRSMRVDAEKDGLARWAQKNDDRVTRVGRFIRKTRIDESPQIFNVLKGDMSFVGPRPERPQFVRELTRQIPYYSSRHTVKPGITGWAQIRYPYGASVEDAVKKLQYDLYYVKNHTLFLDLIILFQTAQVVLLGRGGR